MDTNTDLPPFDPEIVTRILTGHASLIERRMVERWAAERQEHADQWAHLQQAWRAAEGRQPSDEKKVEVLVQAVLGDIATRGRPNEKNGQGAGVKWNRFSKTQTLRHPVWASLGVMILGIGGAVAGWRLFPHVGETRPVAVQTYTTGNSQRAKITLADGSTVMLNVASQLDVPVDYSSGNHTLRLNGEALFDVTHHDATPFTVVTGRTTARVLGTSFVVRDYASDSAATVVVRAGRVVVRSLVLSAGSLVEVSRGGIVRMRPADASEFTFANGVLTLTRVPLSTAIPALDRWYGADIRLGSPALATQEIEGKLSAGSLTDLTALLEMTYNVRVVRDGRILTLYLK